MSKNFLIALSFVSLTLPFAGKASAEPLAFREVSPLVYSGGKPSQEDLIQLQALGVKKIINLQGGNLGRGEQFNRFILAVEPGENPTSIEAERVAALELGMEMISLPLPSFTSFWQTTPKNLTEALEILKTSNEKVYIHCQHGIDRSGLVTSIYRVRQLGEPALKVEKDWKERRTQRLSSLLSSIAMVYYYERAVTQE